MKVLWAITFVVFDVDSYVYCNPVANPNDNNAVDIVLTGTDPDGDATNIPAMIYKMKVSLAAFTFVVFDGIE